MIFFVRKKQIRLKGTEKTFEQHKNEKKPKQMNRKLTIIGGSTTVIVSSSMKYIILTFRIKSNGSAFGSTTFWRKYPLNVRIILSFRTKSGRNVWIDGFFTKPYSVALSLMFQRINHTEFHRSSEKPKKYEKIISSSNEIKCS